jgi:hypothetical protein
MNTIPTLETLADKAGERGATLGAKDALSGTYMNEANARSLISDILLLYMVFVYEEGDDSDIYTGYILSEFMLAYTFAFYTPSSQNI